MPCWPVVAVSRVCTRTSSSFAAAKKATTKKATSRKQAPAKKTSAKKAPAKKAAGKQASAKKLAAKKAATKKDKKLSALDAAAKVLAESKEPMRAKELIEKMAAKEYWKSPGGKTPHATIYAAMLREIRDKGKDARFKKTDRGLFTANG